MPAAIAQVITWPYHQAAGACRTAKNKVRHAWSFVTVENFKELIREIFLQIGRMFKGLGLVAGAPLFAVEFLINKCAGHPTKYSVGSLKHALSDLELEKALGKLEKPARKITCLEFVQPPGTILLFNERSVKSLVNLLPDRMVAKHGALSQDLLKALETHTHYYHCDEVAKTYELRRKIFHLVLPLNRDEALRTIDALVAKGERVVNVYFFGSSRPMEELRDAMIPLDPQTAHQVVFSANRNLACLPSLLGLSESR